MNVSSLVDKIWKPILRIHKLNHNLKKRPNGVFLMDIIEYKEIKRVINKEQIILKGEL